MRVLRELGLVEEWGTGYRRVTQACEEGGNPPPAWQELSSALRVIFELHPEAAGEDSERSDVPNVPISVPANETINETVETINETVETINARQQWFIAQIIAGRQSGWAELAEQWQVSRATARRDIAGLKARGLIEFVGARRTGFYRLAKAN